MRTVFAVFRLDHRPELGGLKQKEIQLLFFLGSSAGLT
jgi:hypothetical protein